MKRKLHVKGIYGKEYLLQKLFLHKKSSEMTWVKGNHYTAFFIVWRCGCGGFYDCFRTRSRSIVNVADTKLEMN